MKREEYEILVFCRRQRKVLNAFCKLHLIRILIVKSVYHPITNNLEANLITVETTSRIFWALDRLVDKVNTKEGTKRLQRLMQIGWVTKN